MQIDDIDILRSAAMLIEMHGADARLVARRRYEALTEAGYETSSTTAARILAAIELLESDGYEAAHGF